MNKNSKVTRSEAYEFFLEEKEYENAMFNRIWSATKEQLAKYLTSPIPEERWLAKEKLKDLKK